MIIDAIIPVLNEVQSIAHVIGEIPAWVREVVVVDSGSTDGTAQAAENAGARVIQQPIRGYGYACLVGAASVKNPDILVFLDGDFSDHPAEMSLLVNPIANGQADLVIGSRLKGNMAPGSMYWHARLGNVLLAWIVSHLTACQITDIGPFRAISWECFKALDMKEGRYGWTIEMMLKAPRQGFRMMEVPVSYRPRIGRSKISGALPSSLKAGAGMLSTVVRYGMQ